MNTQLIEFASLLEQLGVTLQKRGEYGVLERDCQLCGKRTAVGTSRKSFKSDLSFVLSNKFVCPTCERETREIDDHFHALATAHMG
jgi:hypothetical protein